LPILDREDLAADFTACREVDAVERLSAKHTRVAEPGRYRAPDSLLAVLEGL
jgi:hypothetical protein